MLMRLAWTACGVSQQSRSASAPASHLVFAEPLPGCAWCQAQEREGPGCGQRQEVFLYLFYQCIVVMLYGNVCSTHNPWYAVLLKVRTSLIRSLVSCGQTSSNIFALGCFWHKEPCLPPAVPLPCRAMCAMASQLGRLTGAPDPLIPARGPSDVQDRDCATVQPL